MNKPVVRKRRTREHIIADLSVNHVERQVLLCGYTSERPRSDYGYDLFLTTYDDNGEPENGEVRFRLKATDALPLLKDNQTVSWRVLRSASFYKDCRLQSLCHAPIFHCSYTDDEYA